MCGRITITVLPCNHNPVWHITTDYIWRLALITVKQANRTDFCTGFRNVIYLFHTLFKMKESRADIFPHH